MNYERALKACNNQLEFLGIGAWKLTKEKEFEQTIRRCNRRNVPIRFLLTKPENPLLVQAAKQYGINSKEYQSRVRESLRKIADFKNKNINIQVRFYPSQNKRDTPIFRLMFINDSLCLVSYHVFGEGDGSQQPQLHLKKSTKNGIKSHFFMLLNFILTSFGKILRSGILSPT